MTQTVYINGRFLTQALSGVQRYAQELVGALDKRHDDARRFEVLTPAGNIRLTHWKSIGVRQVGRLSGHAWEQIELPRHARNGVLLNLGGSGPLQHARSVVVMHDAAIFAHPENFSWTYRALHTYLRPRLARRAWKLLTVSDFSRGELARYCGVSPARFDVIGDSAEHILAAPSDQTVLDRSGLARGRYILCVGNRTPNKNLGLAASAFLAAKLDGYRLALVGSDHQGVFGKEDISIADSIIFTGRVSDGELRALYENAALFLFPSRYEGFGVPPLEAMTLGCPVLSSDAPVMREVLGDHAAFFRSNDAADLTAQLRIALARAETGRWPVEAPRNHAAQYSWTRNAERLVALLREPLQGIAHAA